jgi:DNA-binding NarL/FixJ family response regulator
MNIGEQLILVSFVGLQPGDAKSLESVYSRRHGFRLTEACRSAAEALAKFADRRPDLAVIGLQALGGPGSTAPRRLKALAPALKVLVLAGPSGDRNGDWWEIVQAGADGVLCRLLHAGQCLRAARTVLAGGHFLAPELTSPASTGTKAQPNRPVTPEAFSPRQRDILALVAAGLPDKQIADRLEIGEGTVATHLKRLFARFEVHTRGALLARYLSNNVNLPGNTGSTHGRS